MKSKVIIFCVLLFCSKFVESIPFAQESVQQRAYQPTKWQGNQNTAEHYHGNGFAQTQSLNSMINAEHRHENSYEHNVNQQRQHLDNYGSNNHQKLQQSLPKKETEVQFASPKQQPNEPKLDGYQVRGNSYPIRPNNHPIKVNNQQYRQRNWQPQNRFVNTAPGTSASAIASASASASANTGAAPERPLTNVREQYYGPNQQTAFVPPANHQHYQADRINTVIKDTHYHPVAERPSNVRYVQNTGSDSGSQNRHVHYENYNEAHVPPINTNVPKSGKNRFIENSPPHSAAANSQSYERLNGSPAIIPDIPKNTGNYHMRQGPNNSNYPNTHTVGRAIPANTVVNNDNVRYGRKPVINSVQSNTFEIPIIPAFDNTENRYLENEPKARPPVNNYRYAVNPTLNLKPDNTVSNTYVPFVPSDMETVNKYLDNIPIIDTETKNQSPAYINEGAPGPTGSILPSNRDNPSTKLKPVEGFDGYSLVPTDISENKEGKSVELQPVPENEPIISPRDDYVNPYKNIYNHVSGPDRGNLAKDKQFKDLFVPSSRYTIIHPNGTVQHINDIGQIRQHNKNYIFVKHNEKPEDGNDLSTPIPPKNTNPDSLASNKDYSVPLVAPLSNGFNQASGPLKPIIDNGYTQPSFPQYPTSNEYNQLPVPQYPRGNNYNPPSEPLSSNGYMYNPFNQTLDSNYQPIPSKLHTHISPGILPTTTISPNDELVKAFLDSLYNKTLNNPSADNPSEQDSPLKDKSPVSITTIKNDDSENSTMPPSPPGIFMSTTPNANAKSDNDLPSSPLDKIPMPTSVYSTSDDNKKPDKNPSSIPLIQKGNDDSSPGESPSDNNYPEWDFIDYTTSPSKLYTKISPGIFRSTTTKDDDTTEPSKLHTKISPGIFSSTNADEDYSTPSPTLQTETSADIIGSTNNNDYTTPSPPKTDITPTDDEKILQFLSSISNTTNNDSTSKPEVPSKNDQSLTTPTENDATTPEPLAPVLSGSSSDITLASVETTTTDTIITISPIEQATDNVKDGPLPSPVDEVTPAYDEQDTINSSTVSPVYTTVVNTDQDTLNSTTPPQNRPIVVKGTDKLDDVIIKVVTDNDTKDTEVISKMDTENKNTTESGDTSATGDNLLESKPEPGDITITVTMPNDSDGNITITVDVPDSTGNEDTSDDSTLILNIDSKNCSITESPTKESNKDQATYDGLDKNFVIDLANSAVFMNKTSDNALLNQMTNNQSVTVVYVFQLQPRPIIERNKVITIFPNNTVVEEVSETTWQNKDDPTPSVFTLTKTYHQGGKH